MPTKFVENVGVTDSTTPLVLEVVDQCPSDSARSRFHPGWRRRSARGKLHARSVHDFLPFEEAFAFCLPEFCVS
jgi:hypothetical protein